MIQEWTPIPGFTDYEVSINGAIRSFDREKEYKSGRKMTLKGKEKKLRVHPENGFLMTDLIDNRGNRKTVYPHKVVAQVYVLNDKPRKKRVVMHIDGNPNNNHYSNLMWASVSESIQKGFETGKRDNSQLWDKRREKYGPKGGNKSMGRPDPLSDSDRSKIIEMRKTENLTLAILADRFKCSISHVHKTLRMLG